MDVFTVLAFWGVSALFVVTPGADWAYAIAAGIRGRVAPAVIGLLLGHLVATIVVAGGVGTLVASMPLLLTILTVTGSLYLVWLGLSTLITPPVASAGDTEGASWLGWAFKGFGVSGLNPKVFLLFLALLPQFVSPEASWPLTAQIVTLGCLHIATCAAVYTAVGLGSRAVLGTRPAAARVVGRVSGALMIVIGLFLIAERLLH